MRRNVALAVLCLALCGSSVRATGLGTDNIQAAVAGGRSRAPGGGRLTSTPPRRLPGLALGSVRPKLRAHLCASIFPVAEAVAKILNPTGAATGAGAATGGLLAAMQQSATGFKQGIASMGATATAQYEALTEQAEAALAALEAQYCKPATFTPSE